MQLKHNADFWLFPEGVNALTPEESLLLETRRRKLLDLYQSWGYQYVMTPLVEFVEPLLNGASDDLILQTQKVTDQLSGRLLGLRADITPQIARLDVHTLNAQGVARYCYADTVYHTRPKLSPEPTRLPLQTGVELFGNTGVASDFEVIALMLESLQALGMKDITLDLGHIGILKSVFGHFSEQEKNELTDIFCRKCKQDLALFFEKKDVAQIQARSLAQLLTLVGEPSVLKTASATFSDDATDQSSDYSKAQGYIAHLSQLSEQIAAQYPDVNIYIDLAETRGYDYHTGCVFAAYTSNCSQMIAKGGRYDGLAERYGKARAATGFTIDLQQMAQVLDETSSEFELIFAPIIDAGSEQSALLSAKIKALRSQGYVIVQALNEGETAPAHCHRQLVLNNQSWEIIDN